MAQSQPRGLQSNIPYFSVCTVIMAPWSTSCMILKFGEPSTPSSRIFTSIHFIPVADQMTMSYS